MQKLFSLILASTMAFGLVACGGGTSTSNTTTAANKDTMAASEEDSSANKDASSEAKSYRIIYVDPAAANPYWVDVASGIQAAAKDLGITVEMSGVDQINHIKQIEEIESAVADHPDGIITMAQNPESFTAPVDYAVKNGVPVVLLDGDAPDSARSFFCGVDTYTQGVQMGEKLLDLVGENAKIGVVTAGLDIKIINDRIDGLKSVCEKHPGMEVVAIEDAHGDTVLAGEKATAMLQTYPEINVMMAAGAADVPGVGLAIDELGLKDKVTGIAFNDDPQGLEYLKTGVYDIILCSLPYEEGYAAVQAMYYTLTGKIPAGSPDKVYLRSVVINADNVDSYKDIPPATFDELLKNAK